MSLLELKNQALQLSFHERAALMRDLKKSLSEAELDALLLEESLTRLTELKNGTVQRVSGNKWYQRGKNAALSLSSSCNHTNA